MTDDQIQHRLRAVALVTVHRGVYRTPGSAVSPGQRALAACLACGTGSVASHRTAAGLWVLTEPVERVVEVTVSTRRCPRPDGVVVHRSPLAASERTRVGVVPLTSVWRTLRDLAGVLSPEQLEAAVDEAFRRKLVTPHRLLDYLRRPEVRRLPGIGGLRDLARDRCDGVPESVLESRALRVIRTFGLPAPVRQFEARVRGRKVRFDFAYPDHHVAVELDGRAPHWGRDRWQSDHDRQNATELAGWRVLGFTWWDVTERPIYVAVAIAEALGLRPARWKPAGQPPKPFIDT
jgi:hypothetical protein